MRFFMALLKKQEMLMEIALWSTVIVPRIRVTYLPRHWTVVSLFWLSTDLGYKCLRRGQFRTRPDKPGEGGVICHSVIPSSRGRQPHPDPSNCTDSATRACAVFCPVLTLVSRTVAGTGNKTTAACRGDVSRAMTKQVPHRMFGSSPASWQKPAALVLGCSCLDSSVPGSGQITATNTGYQP